MDLAQPGPRAAAATRGAGVRRPRSPVGEVAVGRGRRTRTVGPGSRPALLQERRDVEVVVALEVEVVVVVVVVAEHAAGVDGCDRRPPLPFSSSQRSKPAAMTVTRTSSPISSSMTVPKMMLASGWATPWMISAASLTSNRPRSLPPAMLSRMPRAPSMDASSSGLEMAPRAALSGPALAASRSRCP